MRSLVYDITAYAKINLFLFKVSQDFIELVEWFPTIHHNTLDS